MCLKFSSELLVLLPNNALNHVFGFRVHKLHSLDLWVIELARGSGPKPSKHFRSQDIM